MAIFLAAAWIAYLYGAVQVLFHGFRVGDSIFTTVAVFAAAFAVLIFLTCRRLFKPSRKMVQGMEQLISGLKEKNGADRDG